MNKRERAAHDERMASFAASVASSHAQQASAESRRAETALRADRFAAEREDAQRFVGAFAVSAMGHTLRIADLREAFRVGSGNATAHPAGNGQRGEQHV